MFGDIGRFADKMRAIGQESSCTMLFNYGERLKTQSNNFAVEKMKTVLYAYPDLIEQLKAAQQNIEEKEEKIDENNTNTDR
ncbi:hypothetical protein KKHLCK_00160 [Candidatus Electrothrix laxa]